MQPPGLFHQTLAGLQVQVVGVAEDDLGACLADLRRGQGFHGAMGGNRHENRGLDDSMAGLQTAAAGRGGVIGLEELEV